MVRSLLLGYKDSRRNNRRFAGIDAGLGKGLGAGDAERPAGVWQLLNKHT
jgi:hypothetical protein